MECREIYMSNIFNDAPIKSADDDAFGRAPYAKQIANLIQNAHSLEDSTVFGITGPWGSGKSSMLAMIEKELDQGDNQWLFARFTPWATNDVNGILGDFYSALTESLPKNKSKKARKALGTIVRITGPMGQVVPVVGTSIKNAADEFASYLDSQPSWNRAFKEASEELKNLEKPILVITDDIDRLHGNELLTLLKVVRLLGRFPGVHFLLAYDEETVAATMAGSGIAKDISAGSKFMEKIVQYPLPIPPLSNYQLTSRFYSGLEQYIKTPEALKPLSYRLDRIRKTLLILLPTPRSVDRFLAQVHHSLPMFSTDEVELEDVIILTLLKTAFPTLYSRLPLYKGQLLSGKEDGKPSGFNDENREPFKIEAITVDLSEQLKNEATTLLIDLFPAIKRKTPYWGNGRYDKHIFREQYFDRYFAMGVPSYDIPDAEVSRAIDSSFSGDSSPLAELLLQDSAERVIRTIEKARTQTEHLPSEDEIFSLLEVILPLLAKLPRAENSLQTPHQMLLFWSTSLLSQISNSARVSELISIIDLTAASWDRIDLLRFIDPTEDMDEWKSFLLTHVGKGLVPEIIDNIKQGDNAPENFLVEDYLAILSQWGSLHLLIDPIQQGISKAEFTEEDVAARCVTRAVGFGSNVSNTRLNEFSLDKFKELVPKPTFSWATNEIPHPNMNDLSWENRRRFASYKAAQESNLPEAN